MNPTRRTILTATALAAPLYLIAACTPAQQQAAITLAADAMPCYAAVSQTAGPGTSQVLTAALVAASNPACAALDAEALQLIASAVNAGAPVKPGPVSAAVLRGAK